MTDWYSLRLKGCRAIFPSSPVYMRHCQLNCSRSCNEIVEHWIRTVIFMWIIQDFGHSHEFCWSTVTREEYLISYLKHCPVLIWFEGNWLFHIKTRHTVEIFFRGAKMIMGFCCSTLLSDLLRPYVSCSIHNTHIGTCSNFTVFQLSSKVFSQSCKFFRS